MSENVVQLKPKAFDGLYELPGKGNMILRQIFEYGRLNCNLAFCGALGDEQVRRAYFEVAENANHLLRRWFASPKHYNLDAVVLKRDLTQEYNFSFLLSGVNKALNAPILSFHINVHFAPTQELIDIADQVFQPSFPFASSVQKAKDFFKESGEKNVICSVEQLNQLISDLEETAAEFDRKRFGFISNTGKEGERPVIVMGYRYFDPFIDNVAGSNIIGFEIDGVRKTALVEIRLEAMLDFIDLDIEVQDGVE